MKEPEKKHAARPDGAGPIETRPISEILRCIRNKAARERHELSLYFQAFKGSDWRGVYFRGAGANYLRIALADGNVMKITLATITPEMGTRPFDLPILDRGVFTSTRLPVSFFIQPEAYPVIIENYRAIRSQIQALGYLFTDPGGQQVGYYRGRTYLLDPLAVTKLPTKTDI